MYVKHLILVYIHSYIARLGIYLSSLDDYEVSWRSSPWLCDHPAMRSRIHAVAFPSEIGDFADEVRPDLPGARPRVRRRVADRRVLPAARRLRDRRDARNRRGSAGRRRRRRPRHRQGRQRPDRRREGGAPRRARESSFHLVERGFGRFARAVRLAAPCDTSPARAHARRRRAAHHRCRRSPSAAGTADSDRDRRSTWPIADVGLMRLLFIGDIVGRPGPRAGPARPRRRSSTTTRSTSSSPTPRTPPPASASRARSATSCSTGAST